MGDPIRQWLEQADYDMETAQYMFDGGRYFYAVFMLHLSIEKALKGLYQKKLDDHPPKVHNLVFLLRKTGCMPPEKEGKFIVRLNQANVATRYPEDLSKLMQDYDRRVTEEILTHGRETMEWIKTQF